MIGRAVAAGLLVPAALHAEPARETSELRSLDIARLPVREADVGVSRVAIVSQFANAELNDGTRAANLVGALGHLRVNDTLGIGVLVPVSSTWYSHYERIDELAIASPRLDVALKLHARDDGRAIIGIYTAGTLNWQQEEDVLGEGSRVTGAFDYGFAFTAARDITAVHLDVGGHLPFGSNNARRTVTTGTALAVRAARGVSVHAAVQTAIDSRGRPYWNTAIAASLGTRVAIGATELELGARYAFNPESELIYNSLSHWSAIVNVVRRLPR